MIELTKYFKKYSFQPRGAIHVGAHKGEEVDFYIQAGFSNIILIEANPFLYKILCAKFERHSKVKVIHAAITDFNGNIDLRLTSHDQSSSILKLKNHKLIYPSISEIGTVNVPARTLDHCLFENRLGYESFNFLSLDIQGAELLALKGCASILRHIEIINTEVSTEELYQDCSTLDDLERFLRSTGFNRIALSCPYHPSWGDALYIKKRLFSMETLGQNGRFGNQIFQYFFLNVVSTLHDSVIHTPTWIGSSLFDLSDAQPIIKSPRVYEKSVSDQLPSPEVGIEFDQFLTHDLQFPVATDIFGYFQPHTAKYRRFRDLWQRTFSLRNDFEQLRKNLIESISVRGRGVIAIHLRRGDYGSGDSFYRAPASWYEEWLSNAKIDPAKYVIYVASDEPQLYENRFSDFDVITARLLDVQQTSIAVMLADFFILMSADILCISNSSFSFAAALCNKYAECFLRPNFDTRQLVEFDPWNSEVLEKLKLLEEDHKYLNSID